MADEQKLTNPEKGKIRSELQAALVQSMLATLDPSNEKFNGGKPFSGLRIFPKTGLRYIGVDIIAEYEAERLMKLFKAGTNAATIVPWTEGEDRVKPQPSVFYFGDRIKFVVRLPHVIQADLLLEDLWASVPRNGLRFLAGIDDMEHRIELEYSDQTPHMKWVGMTGSGKTSGMMSASIQIAQSQDVMIVVMDGKDTVNGHPDWKFLDGHPNLWLPVADTLQAIEQTCAMLMEQLGLRMRDPELRKKKLVVFFDEVQEIVNMKHVAILDTIRQIGVKGREAGIHLNIGTQYPSADELGSSAIKAALGSTICFKTLDGNHTRLALGEDSSVTAHDLTMDGDSYILRPGWEMPKRVQWAFVPEERRKELSLRSLAIDAPRPLQAMHELPDDVVLALETPSNGNSKGGRPREPFPSSVVAAAVSLLADEFAGIKLEDIARDTFNKALRNKCGSGVGSNSVSDLIAYAAEIRSVLSQTDPTESRGTPC